MSRFWSPLVASLSPYVPGEQPKAQLTKLNTNELPWAPSSRALEAIGGANNESLRLYPDPESVDLRAALAKVAGVSSAEVFVGNGSDEVLAHVFRALFQPRRPLLFPDISYSFYPVYAALFGLDYETVPLDDDFAVQLEDYQRPNGGIIFANPNAPTGVVVGAAAIASLLAANPDTVVVVDEAYVDFGGESVVPLIHKFSNLLVVQTLSKSRGLAGLRVGAAFGDAALIEGLQRVKDSFNSYPLDRLAQAGAIAALEDVGWFNDSCQRLIELREWLAAELRDRGFGVLPSAANFLFARPDHGDAAKVFAQLRERGVLVRHFAKPRIDEFLRITVGTREECQCLLDALDDLG
ncbi:histidinol-phosphate transaminase [Halieaceae bacterium IMCC14734]|uniref:Histidinol-phosphate aminotransferase n=1 Tax=Candidatus Litorirhabdus singularis TaxID=2518993 RepID=A0ABT3TI69_9GAMM|nr:histidinol-phosphate transaminase [Candidatus Litorirhabdus singularis]MCX2981485.1 histidinol-phosphate transaminase [Candidatus Litorirhabdus singularis]